MSGAAPGIARWMQYSPYSILNLLSSRRANKCVRRMSYESRIKVSTVSYSDFSLLCS